MSGHSTPVTILIPTASDDEPLTIESIPDEYPVRVEREGSLNEARNRGVSACQTPYVIIMDDDLRFPPSVLTRIKDRLDEETLVGVHDWDFGWVAGRVMAFHRNLWAVVGGFDERLGSHMGDTEFAISARLCGYETDRLPREVVEHEPHDRSISAWDRIWRLGYLSVKYPRAAPRLISGVVR